MAIHANPSAFSFLLLAFLFLVGNSISDPEFDFKGEFSLPSASESDMIQLDDINRSLTFMSNTCHRDDSRDSCQTLLSEFAMLALSLSQRRRLDLLNMFLKQSMWRVEIAMSVMNEARSGSIGVKEDADLVDCEVMMNSAKDRMVNSLEKLQGRTLLKL